MKLKETDQCPKCGCRFSFVAFNDCEQWTECNDCGHTWERITEQQAKDRIAEAREAEATGN